MTRKIRISGEIGLDFTSEDILAELDAAAGDDLQIDIASPGGSVFDGLELYNAIVDYSRSNPGANIAIRIEGLAASMASYIAMVPVASTVKAEANAVVMIHNPWNAAIGDFREMRRNADFLEGLSGILSKAYAAKARKSTAEISKLMDSETWLFGSEIKDAGFVDEILGQPVPATQENKGAAVASAKLRFQKLQADMGALKPEPQKVAAALRSLTGGSSRPADGQDFATDDLLRTAREREAEENLEKTLEALDEKSRPASIGFNSEFVDMTDDEVAAFAAEGRDSLGRIVEV